MDEHLVGRSDAPVADGSRSARDEVERIVRSATIWTAVGAITPAVGLGPLAAAGWRPADLPLPLAVVWCAGALIAAVGLGLLIWAGCPALGDDLAAAYRQKMQSVRFGIVLNIAGMAIAGGIVLLSPATR